MPEPKSFEITGWQEIIKPLLTKGVGDSGVPATLVQAKASHDGSFNVGPLVFSIQPDAQASIVVVNSKDDLDNDAVQGALGFVAGDDVPPPLISRTREHGSATTSPLPSKPKVVEASPASASTSMARKPSNCLTAIFIPTDLSRFAKRYWPICSR